MAIIITPDEIREICPTSYPDAVIEDLICTVQDRIGECAESSYPECTATTILKYSVCHLLESMQGGSKKSVRSANGASISNENYGGGEGLKSTAMGRLLLSLDTAGCTSNLVADTVLFISVGDAARPC